MTWNYIKAPRPTEMNQRVAHTIKSYLLGAVSEGGYPEVREQDLDVFTDAGKEPFKYYRIWKTTDEAMDNQTKLWMEYPSASIATSLMLSSSL